MGRKARRAPMSSAAIRVTPTKRHASLDADRVELTSPEQCDQNVMCRSSLKQIGNE